MKVSIGAYIKDGPWGGGNLFFQNLKKHLEQKGHKVINHLLEDDIDLILLTDPRKDSESSSFTNHDIEQYKEKINPNTKVVHRVNECDERKETKGLNEFIFNANKCADSTVFVSEWIKNLYFYQGYELINPKVIMSGSNTQIFNKENKNIWNKNEKIAIVTHHWGGNWNKGFDIYSKLDELLDDLNYSSKFEFTYIGNLPDNFKFKNVKVIKPLSGKNLAEQLKKNHIYLTASLNEPSGNHHIEGALCGLPILFIDSGALPEYCEEYGIKFNPKNFHQKLFEMQEQYFYFIENLKNYPYKSESMCDDYEKLFIRMIEEEKKEIAITNKKQFYKKLTLSIKRIIFLNLYNLFRKNKLWK